MRLVQHPELESGIVDISKIQFDLKSRDDIPQILRGLQHIYITPAIRNEVFKLLEEYILPEVDKKTGRPGMELWKIFVMGVLRLDLNCDYDRLQELVNYHKIIRLMLGHNLLNGSLYHIQTLKDNVGLLTPELLEQINRVVVEAGHVLLKKKGNEVLRGRCDSFVVETNVHYPTDISLLLDAMRKVITLTASLCVQYNLSDWRQSRYNIRHLKRLMRVAQNKKRARGKTEEQKEANLKRIKKAHQEYILIANQYLSKIDSTLESLKHQNLGVLEMLTVNNINNFIVHAKRQIDQIGRRVLHDEIIPHEEKVFSIFEPHTEWIVKGKAGVPVELGLRVCIVEDQYQFILHHDVMEKQTDDQIAIEIVRKAQTFFPALRAASFDKGFHSPKNQEILGVMLDLVALPRKGKLSQASRVLEESEAFRKARRKHSAVESAINALEVHGLDRCPDHGITGFKRYVALAIVARNIQRVGAILQKQEQRQAKRALKKYQGVAINKLAA